MQVKSKKVRILENDEDVIFANEKQVIKLIHDLTIGQDAKGNEIPAYCFIKSIVDEFLLDEEEVIAIARKIDCRILKTLQTPEIESGIIIANKNCDIPTIEKEVSEMFGMDVDIVEITNNFNENLNGDNQKVVDSEGSELSTKQIEFFKDSKIRDNNGNLLVVNHGTNATFNVFSRGDIGYHFGTKKQAQEIIDKRGGGHIDQYYLNIKKYLYFNGDPGTWGGVYLFDEFTYLVDDELIDLPESAIEKLTNCGDLNNFGDLFKNTLIENGYDGVVYRNTFEAHNENGELDLENAENSFIAFYPNQIKAITNKEPSNSDNIKESTDKMKKYIKIPSSNVKEILGYISNNKNLDFEPTSSTLYEYNGYLIGPKDEIKKFISMYMSKLSSLSGDQYIIEKAEKHETLNPKLWNEDGTLKDEVREKIMEICDEFLDDLKEDGIKFKLDDIRLVGSNCSYNYNEHSDLDIHLIMDTDSLECPDDLYPLLYSAYRSLFNKKFDVDFYDIPVEIYVETSDTEQLNDESGLEEARKTSALKSNGIYSVMNNKWLKEPVASDIPEIDESKFDELYDVWEDKYFEIVESNDVEKIKDFIEDIYDLRKESIANEGEYGLGNLVFKEFRNLGFLDNLKDLKNVIKSKALSLEALKEELVNNQEIFWHMRSLVKDLFKEYDFNNLYLDGNVVKPIPNKLLKNKFSVSCEQARDEKLMSRDELEAFKEKYDGKYIVFFLANDDKYGGEYSIILSDEKKAQQATRDYNQDGYAWFKSDGSYGGTRDANGKELDESLLTKRK